MQYTYLYLGLIELNKHKHELHKYISKKPVHIPLNSIKNTPLNPKENRSK